MNADESIHADAAPAEPPLQFSLRSMFILTTVVAVFCSGLFACPGLVRFLTLLAWMIFLPTTMLAVAIYGRGYLRTFSIGGFCAAAPLLFSASFIVAVLATTNSTSIDVSEFDTDSEFWYLPGSIVGGYTLLTLLMGLVVVGIRAMINLANRRQSADRAAVAKTPVVESTGST
jgi:hypothetical protein